ncbi:hypothetical protein BD289DRAFT_445920 [Coniella lustricola]|uniref:Uncharacterized protein n=1 Tax=Coniella lustricola TaxID=2025994 RepID=A0A2T2ZUF8_9PEZI|nr:hypothetical protein BD289DRAFT_445920 [Coniella lustricola]
MSLPPFDLEIQPFSECLTIILTTSPTPSSPSTELVDTILDSFREHCPVLLQCRIIVVFDTYDKVGPVNRLKKGHVTEEGATNFPVYKASVKEVILRDFCGIRDPRDVPAMMLEMGKAEYGSWGTAANPNATPYEIQSTPDRRVVFIEPVERLGFGLGVRSALRVVQTPYVWVQQHDWKLDAHIPVEPIVDVMKASRTNSEVPVKYVCLPSIRMLGYAESEHVLRYPALRQLTKTFKRDFIVASGACRDDDDDDDDDDNDSDGKHRTIPLTPLFFWHDKTHIASTAHYLERVFPSRLAMPRGAFIEDHIGQRARNQMKLGEWTRWACWLYYPDNGKEQCLKHLHGRTWRGTEAERKKIHEFRLQNGTLPEMSDQDSG